MTSSSQTIRPDSARIEREPGTAQIRFTVPEDFYFCRGHFPGNPMVPGAVVAAWMREAADLAGSSDAMAGRLENLKLRSALIPGEPVTVAAHAEPAGVRVTVHSKKRLCADALFCT